MAKKNSDNASWLRPLPADFAKDGMSSKKRLIFSALTVVVLAGFSVLIWLSYTSEGEELGPVPVVRADNSVVKKKPDEPGGKEIPFQDKEVFSRVDNLPAEEENIIASSAEIPLKRPVAEDIPQPAEETEAKDLETEAAEVAEKITPAAPPPPPVVKATSGDYMIQIGAYSTRESAQKAWAMAYKDHADVVGSLEPEYVLSKSLYVVRGGMINSREEADNICTALKKKKQGCFVVVAK